MRKWRALSCVLLACFISCLMFGTASASGTLIDDLPIDPWGDLEDVENYEPPEPTDPNFSDPYEKPPVEQPPNNSFFSLDDTNPVRFISWSEGIQIGFKGGFSIDVPAGSGEFTIGSTDITLYEHSGMVIDGSVGMRINPGTTFDYIANVNYSPAEYESFELSGAGVVYFYAVKATSMTLHFHPDTIQLLVNGQPYGQAVSISEDDGTFTFPVLGYRIEEQVYSIGYRFTFDVNHENVASRSDSGSLIEVKMHFDDDGIFTFMQVPEEPEYTGLLDTIIGWLTNIWEGIKNIGKSILDGLESLFVPSEEDIVEIKEMYSALLEERLGFVYEGFVMLDEAFEDLKEAFTTGNDYTFTFPGIAFPMNGEMVTIVEEQEIDMNNKFMDTVRPVFGTIVCLFSVAGVVRTSADMVVAIISGVSPFAFYRKQDEIWETLWGEDS